MSNFTYILKNDLNSGAIEIYSPNLLHDRILNWDSLVASAKLHNVKPLEVAKKFMQMYEWNYGGKSHYPIAQKRIDNWNKYIKNRIKEC